MKVQINYMTSGFVAPHMPKTSRTQKLVFLHCACNANTNTPAIIHKALLSTVCQSQPVCVPCGTLLPLILGVTML